MAVIHISEAEAAKDFAAVMTKVRAGVEVFIDDGDAPIAILKSASKPNEPMLISEALRGAEERGSTVTLEDQFGNDMEKVIELRRSTRMNRWD